MKYVTFDESGALTGAYIQDLHPDHADAFIEVDDAQYSAWVVYRANAGRDGLELAPVVAPAPIVPQSVTMRQARLALLGAGLLANVDAAIASLPSPPKEEVAIEWEYSQTVERDRPFVAMLGAALGLDAAALDALFVTAAAL